MIEDKINKADAEIMEVVYNWAKINFDVEEWLQDSTEIRNILAIALQDIRQETLEEVGSKVKYYFNGYGGTLGFTQGELLEFLSNKQ